VKATNVLKKLTAMGETDVSRKIFSLIIFLLVLMYISAGMFMVLENFRTDSSLLFNETLYFVVVTLATVGYGDIVPATIQGKVLTMFIIVYTIVIVVP
jgi:voltage-gated potassium channel